MVEVILSESDNLDWALRRFRRQVIRSGLMREMKKHRYYEKPSVSKRRKAKAAARRRARANRTRNRR